MGLLYAERSKVNQMLLAVKAKSRLDVDEWLILSVKPKVKPERFKEVVSVVHDYRLGLTDLWDAGTAFAHCLGYNVIKEDTLNV